MSTAYSLQIHLLTEEGPLWRLALGFQTAGTYLDREETLYCTVFVETGGLPDDLLQGVPMPELEAGVPQGGDDGQLLLEVRH